MIITTVFDQREPSLEDYEPRAAEMAEMAT
jgi:hypothetical protein